MSRMDGRQQEINQGRECYRRLAYIIEANPILSGMQTDDHLHFLKMLVLTRIPTNDIPKNDEKPNYELEDYFPYEQSEGPVEQE